MDIEITRPKQYQDKIRDYHLIVDGNKVAKIKPNSKSTITIPDDAVYIQAKVDWCTSPKFSVQDIQSSKVTIQNTFGGNLLKAIFLPVYYITFGKGRYLIIKSVI